MKAASAGTGSVQKSEAPARLGALGMESKSAVPSIDILGGKAVRLLQGRRETAEVLGEPLALAAKYAALGFPWLHIVDLDAAFGGGSKGSRGILPSLAKASGSMKIQWGGGIRTAAQAEEALAAGATRVVFGTSVFSAPQEVRAAVDSLGAEKVWASLDFSGMPPVAKIRGWKESAGADVLSALAAAEKCGVGGAVISSVDADGMMNGPNLRLAAEVSGMRGWQEGSQWEQGKPVRNKPFWLAGGMRNAQDAKAAFSAGAQGAIFGRALYSKEFDLEGLSCLQGE